MIRFFFVRIILPLLIILFLRSFIRTIFAGIRTAAMQSRPPEAPTVKPGMELKKDPVCGTYVSTAASLTRSVDGHLVYFCSKECRDKYRVA
jgi:YHS domain-containing protein